jgi:HSP20 family protein
MENDRAKEKQETERGTGASSKSLTRSGGGITTSPTLLPIANPFSFMRRLVEDLDDLIVDGRRAGDDRRLGTLATWAPPLEIVERDGQLVVRAEVPGVTKDQLRVDVEDGQLVISGERKQDFEEKRGGMYRSERSYGHFTRVIGLPEGTEVDQAKATFANGVLEVTLPAPRRDRGKSIEISAPPEPKPGH